MNKVVILGTGIMARGIAAGFLAAGMPVVLLGRTRERTAGFVDECRRIAAGTNAASGTNASPGAGSVRANAIADCASGSIEDWDDWSGVELVIETVAEDLELKRGLFAQLDRRVPPGIAIGSNSSSYPISRISQDLATRERMLGVHYFMPAQVVPLVEVVLGAHSDPELAERVCALYRRIGKSPVLVRKDIPGFLANRIQHALMREALALIDSGIASPEDVDLAVRHSFGFRYAAVGPILQKEISGWDTTLRASTEIYPSLCNDPTPARCLHDLVAQGRIGIKSGAGFFPWPPERAAAVRADYERKLAAAFAILASDDAPHQG